jgi:hypothetical protein
MESQAEEDTVVNQSQSIKPALLQALALSLWQRGNFQGWHR